MAPLVGLLLVLVVLTHVAITHRSEQDGGASTSSWRGFPCLLALVLTVVLALSVVGFLLILTLLTTKGGA